ncbi:O-antigen ligase family protein [Gorillibacterium timonense]|uniref:O-antigen ligase family protein n=1 Tax=Gorillibacterium timonense TaxID=1689269 RepID=UPI00071CF11B|nr:O-antigen ligase family protein [Gorillibacterium timonense]
MSSAKKKTPQTVLRRTDEKVQHSILYWAIMLFTIGFLFIAPFSKGLFQSNHNEFNYSIGIKFQDPTNTALTFSFIALLLLAFFSYYFFSIQKKADYLIFAVWLIPLCYFIGIFRGVSFFTSLQGFYVQLMFAAFFSIGAALVRFKKGAALLVHGILASAYAVIIFGFMTWLGNVPNKGYVIIDGTGTRLSSVFTYANTYAGFLIALLLAGLYLSATASKRWLTFAHAFFLVPALVSLLLTLSRGGWVLLPVLFLVVLPFVRFTVQLVMTAELFIAGLAAVLISSSVTNNGIKLLETFDTGLMIKTWAILIGVSILSALIAVLIRYGADKWFTEGKVESKLRYSNLWFPVAVIVAGGLLFVLLLATPLGNVLPDSLQQRLENINFNQHSVRERGYFYLDSWKIAKDYLFFGTGSGGWTNLYHMYQSYPYTSRQAHNFFFQVLIDIGVVGLLITFVFVGIVFFLHIRSRGKKIQDSPSSLAFFIIAIGLLAHSFIDFDMSYAFMGALFFLCLGGMLGTSRSGNEEKETSTQHVLNRYRWAYPGLLGALSLVMIIVSFQATIGSNKAMATVTSMASGQINLEETTGLLTDASTFQKSNIDYRLMQVDIYNQAFSQTKDMKYAEQGEAILKKLDRKEPNLIEPYEYRFSWAMEAGKPADALPIAEEMLRRNPWNTVYYERVIGLHYQLGEANWDTALQRYKQAQDHIAQMNEIPKAIAIGNPLQISKGIALPVAQIHYYQGDYAAVSEILQPYLDENLGDPQNLEIARYYAAALDKQGNPDRTWYDKLIAKDANEKTVIEQLLQGKK